MTVAVAVDTRAAIDARAAAPIVTSSRATRWI